MLVAAAQGRDEEPPLSGRPERFNGAVGNFQVQMEATPTKIEVEKPLRLTIRVTAVGPVRRAPSRPDLGKERDFTGSFHIDAPNPSFKQIDPSNWEFYYLLKPKSRKVEEVPEVAFCYFDPWFGQDARGYQTRYADAIPLEVIPVKETAPPIEKKAADPPLPAAIGELAPASEVLERPSTPFVPGPALFVLLLVLPVVGCLAWFLAWQRLHPDAARQARQRRSRAAQVALQALRDIEGDGRERAARAAAVVAGYLHQRFDLHAQAPGPDEVDAFLDRLNPAPELRTRLVEFFRTCDALRFAPTPPAAPADLAGVAGELILAVEAEPWPSLPS
jgi:hypothetical protein